MALLVLAIDPQPPCESRERTSLHITHLTHYFTSKLKVK